MFWLFHVDADSFSMSRQGQKKVYRFKNTCVGVDRAWVGEQEEEAKKMCFHRPSRSSSRSCRTAAADTAVGPSSSRTCCCRCWRAQRCPGRRTWSRGSTGCSAPGSSSSRLEGDPCKLSVGQELKGTESTVAQGETSLPEMESKTSECNYFALRCLSSKEFFKCRCITWVFVFLPTFHFGFPTFRHKSYFLLLDCCLLLLCLKQNKLFAN